MQTEDFPYLPTGPAEVNKMIKEHGDLFSDSQCKVCSAVLISESQKLTHYQSKKHANKMRRYISMQNDEPAVKKLKPSPQSDCNNGDTDRTKECPLCNMTFSSPVIAESHYQGKVHAKKLKLKMVGLQDPAAQKAAVLPKKKPAEDTSDGPMVVGGCNNNNNNATNPDRFCSTCQASFNNPLMAQQHYEGKKHRKQMTKLKLMETYGPSTVPASTQQGYQCAVCKIELNSVEQYQSHVSGAKHKNQMKKLGKNTTENQESAEQSLGGGGGDDDNDKFPSGDDQYAAAEEQDQYAPTHDQFAPEDYQYGGGEEEAYAAGDNQYTPEDKQYSEEYQYT